MGDSKRRGHVDYEDTSALPQLTVDGPSGFDVPQCVAHFRKSKQLYTDLSQKSLRASPGCAPCVVLSVFAMVLKWC